MPQLLDYGDHFTGPSGTGDDKARSLVFTIAQDRRSEQGHYDSGWAHNAGLPIVLSRRATATSPSSPWPRSRTSTTARPS